MYADVYIWNDTWGHVGIYIWGRDVVNIMLKAKGKEERISVYYLLKIK